MSNEQLLMALREAAAAAQNAASLGGLPDDFARRYLQWAHGEARRLRNLVRPEDLERLVFTRQYWAVQSMHWLSAGEMLGVLHLELEGRQRDLVAAQHAVEADLRRWRDRPGALVMPDTNVYLHHPEPFDVATWPATIGALPGQEVHLLTPLLVVDELDNAKRGPDKVRSRARSTLRRLGELLGEQWTAQIHPSQPENGVVTVDVILDPPGHVRLPRADDELVDRARDVQDRAGRSVQLVTYDSGVMFRARAAGLEVIALVH